MMFFTLSTLRQLIVNEMYKRMRIREMKELIIHKVGVFRSEEDSPYLRKQSSQKTNKIHGP